MQGITHTTDGSGFVDKPYADGNIVRCMKGYLGRWIFGFTLINYKFEPSQYISHYPCNTQEALNIFLLENIGRWFIINDSRKSDKQVTVDSVTTSLQRVNIIIYNYRNLLMRKINLMVYKKNRISKNTSSVLHI